MRDLLRPLGFQFQVPMQGTTRNGGVYDYILDAFHAGANLAVEIDGNQHKGRARGRDRRRTSRLAYAHDLRVIRFLNKRVLNPKQVEAIIAEVLEAMNNGKS